MCNHSTEGLGPLCFCLGLSWGEKKEREREEMKGREKRKKLKEKKGLGEMI